MPNPWKPKDSQVSASNQLRHHTAFGASKWREDPELRRAENLLPRKRWKAPQRFLRHQNGFEGPTCGCLFNMQISQRARAPWRYARKSGKELSLGGM